MATSYKNNLFGPVGLGQVWDSTDSLQWTSEIDETYIYDVPNGEAGLYVRGVAFDTSGAINRYTYFARVNNRNTGGLPVVFHPSGTKNNRTFIELLKDKKIAIDHTGIEEGGTPIHIIKQSAGNSELIGSVLTLGISEAENNTLIGLTNANVRFSTLVLKDLGEQLDDHGNRFFKYEVGVKQVVDYSLDVLEESGDLFPTAGNEVYVYSQDDLVFISQAYGLNEDISGPYVRNKEEEFGARNIYATRTYDITAIDVPNNKVSLTNSAHPFLKKSSQSAFFQNILQDRDLSDVLLVGDEIEIKKSGDAANNKRYLITNIMTNGSDVELTLDNMLSSNPATKGEVQAHKFVEDYFIDLDKDTSVPGDKMRLIVDNFIFGIDSAVDFNEVQIEIDNYGPDLFNRGKDMIHHEMAKAEAMSKPDDRPLYWARIKMAVVLKTKLRELLIAGVIGAVEQRELIQRFEEKTRNYTGIDFSAGSVPAGAFKLLVTGFDPFQLDNSVFQSNPSGPAALNLCGKTISTGTKDVYIQMMIFPVRWEDFDNDVVNKYISNYIGGGVDKPDMILTISQSGMGNYNMDRFATINRGGGSDNLLETRRTNSRSAKDLTPIELWKYHNIETQLPKKMAQEHMEPTDPAPDTWNHFSVYAQYFEPLIGASVIPEAPDYEMDWKFTLENLEPHDLASVLTYTRKPTPTRTMFPYMKNGPGGNYLSNEIFYRVSLARERWKALNPTAPKYPSGHFHVSFIHIAALKEGFDLDDKYTVRDRLFNWENSSRTVYNEQFRLVKTVEDRMKRGIEGYNSETDLFNI